MSSLKFDFTVDKSTNSVLVNKEFAAEFSLVWDAFTKQEILDRWWAPKPWVSKTKEMTFKTGGHRLYAMVSPEGQEHWSIEKYTLINPKTSFNWVSSFADQDGNVNAAFPSSEWKLAFNEENGVTKVNVVITHKLLADLEAHLKMGFKEGFTMALNELDTILSTIEKEKS